MFSGLVTSRAMLMLVCSTFVSRVHYELMSSQELSRMQNSSAVKPWLILRRPLRRSEEWKWQMKMGFGAKTSPLSN